MRKYLKRRDNRIILVFFLITMIVAISPLISRYCINGHDLEYHLLRIESLKEGILIGRPFLKVNTLFFGGAGYASSLFYSDLFMHIPALLRVCHFGIGTSFHLYTALIFVLCYISTFYCVWKMSLSKFAGTVAAVLVTLCPYHMDDMLVRTACGENAAFIFLPLAIYGVFNVLYEEMDKPWVFGLGMAGLILTHPATCILMTCVCVVAFLINIKILLDNPRVLVRLCVVAVLALLVTAYQWLPMLEQFAHTDFYVANNWTDLLDSSVGFSEIASTTFPCIGFALFALIIPRIFLTRRDYPILKFIDLCIIAALIFAVGATNIMPWEKVARFFGFLQFPWRLFIMSSVLLSVADAVILRLFLDRFKEDNRRIAFEIVLILITAVMMKGAIDHQNENSMGYYDYSDDYYSFKPFTAGVIAGEWLPAAVTDVSSLVEQSDRMVFDDGSACDFTRKRAKVISKIDSVHEYVDVPFIYYKGYSAVIVDDAGNKTKLEVSGDGENGMCRVELLGRTGELTVSYTGTILQKVALIVSHLFILLIFDLLYLKNKYKKKLRLRAAAAGANLGKVSIVLVFALLSGTLSACNVATVPSSGYYDPDEMIDYLKDVNGDNTDESDGVSEEDLVRINYSHKGYDRDGKKYAVRIDESSGEQMISVVKPDAKGLFPDGEDHVTGGLYAGLLDEEVSEVLDRYRTDSLEGRIMHETDALLCLEVFPEPSKRKKLDDLAVTLADDIFGIPSAKIETVLDKYDCAAVLAKAAYVLTEWERADDAGKLAEQYFKDAESVDEPDAEPVAARLWAAAELYRLTGQKTYRSVVDAIAMDVVPEGFSYDEPGFFGLFAYLMSPHATNYNVCTNMMSIVFSKANELIKEPIDKEFLDTRVDSSTAKRDEKTAVRMMDEAFLVTMTNYVSVSVEYKEFVQNRLNYIFGANLSGIDFTEDDNALSDSPRLFVLIGL
ncbi:MAG: glycoside hydrolase family 9 protein [Lachnospiraceae bacterium]|nr:glycoside hydrolase family 9 protein [Lachnospiraceae bacterium]